MGEAVRKVLMSPELMAQWATRDVEGNRLTWDWGKPDADGFYTPSVTVHYDNNLREAAIADALRAVMRCHLPIGDDIELSLARSQGLHDAARAVSDLQRDPVQAIVTSENEGESVRSAVRNRS